MKLIVVCPHFAPDTAPTGTVMTRIVEELVEFGHEVHVVTTVPWYRNHRVEPEWAGTLIATEHTGWGSITRIHPLSGGDKTNLVRRAFGFLGFSVLATFAGLRAGGWFQKADAVIAMSPPLTLGVTGRLVAFAHRAKLVFNIQDIFPDAATVSGALAGNGPVARGLLWGARTLERVSYRMADAVTVLSDDLAENVAAKVARDERDKVVVIPNFAATDQIVPTDRMTPYRDELGVGDAPVVLYAGNVGFSQALDLVIAAAQRLPSVHFVINGEGSARDEIDRAARSVDNLHVRDYQPTERLNEVLATGDIHVVPLKPGLGNVSVPSKTYSSLAAGRPIVAAIDPGTMIPNLLDDAAAGTSTSPDDVEGFAAAIESLLADPDRRAAMGAAGRAWVEANASPTSVARLYEDLLIELIKSPPA